MRETVMKTQAGALSIRILLAAVLLLMPVAAAADEVITDNLTVDGSLCVGSECAEGEVFGFDTLKLKTANPQIRFMDTSNTEGFPTNDWTMGVAAGNENSTIFYVNDVETGSTVLQLSSGTSGGVALGAGSELVDNAISVGSVGAERQIKHVDNGTEPNDAVNVSQLEQVAAAITSRIDDLVSRLEALEAP